MKKLLSFVLLFSIVAFGAAAQEEGGNTAENANAPEFRFEQEVHDFGTIEEGTKAEFKFEFVNNGKEPLIIQNVRASCGCTTPSWSREPIPPGGKGHVTAVYNSKGRPGTFSKSITITSNAKTPTKILQIKGKVQRVVDNAPEKAPSMLAEPNN